MFYYFTNFDIRYRYEVVQGSPCRAVSNVLDCNLVVSEFELQLLNYIHFWTKAIRKDLKTLVPQAMG